MLIYVFTYLPTYLPTRYLNFYLVRLVPTYTHRYVPLYLDLATSKPLPLLCLPSALLPFRSDVW